MTQEPSRRSPEVENRAAELSATEDMPWPAAVAQAEAEHPEKTTPRTSVILRSFDDIDDDVPTWVWTHGDNGRIPLGALTLFAGRPAAGKSTAARWFAAQVTRGTLPGEWYGTPHNVAYIAAEESAKFAVKPSLRASGADMRRMMYPELVTRTEDIDEAKVNYVPTSAMSMFAQALRDNDVKLVIVDPLMTMLGAGTDIYRNNEVRERVQPWVDLADQIDGVVIGISHLNKSVTGDVLAAVNGSSAFGELCRAAFGFAQDPDDEEGSRVMSQVKNSLGVEDLSLTYTLTPETVTTSSGKTAEMPRFTILGESDRKVGEILRAASAPVSERGTGVREVVVTYLRSQPGNSALAEDVKAEVEDRGCNFRTAQNQREKWGVQTVPEGKKKRWTLVEKSADTSHSAHDTSRTTGSVMCDVSSSEGVSDTSHHTSQTPPSRSDVRLTVVPDASDPAPEVLAAVLDALDDSAEHGLSEGALMRTVRELTGSGTNVPAVLDALTTEGQIHRNHDGRYTRTVEKGA